MFGRNSDDGASDSTSLWAKALGLGPIMDAIRDPQLISKAMTAVDVMAHSAMANLRVEAKLDILLKERGYDVDAINRDVSARYASGGFNGFGHNAGGDAANGGSGPVVLDGNAAARTGPRAIAGGAADDGSGPAAKHHRKTGGK